MNSGIYPQRLVWINNIPTPYRLHLFDAIRIQSERRGISFEGRFMAAQMGARRFHEDLPSTLERYVVERGLQLQRGEFVTHINVRLIFRMLSDPPKFLVVCGWSELTSALLILCARLRKKRAKILMWAEANRHSMQLEKGPAASVRRYLCNRCDAIIVPGQIARDTIRSDFGVTVPPLITLPNLVSEDIFSREVLKARSRRSEIRYQFGLSIEDRVLVCCARLNEHQKGLQRFLEHVYECWPRWLTMCIAGDGPDAHNLSRWIERTFPPSKVRLIGQLKTGKLVQLLAASDVFVLPSMIDPNPLSVIEALWSGLPVLLSNRCGNWPEAVDPGRNGWVFDPTDGESVRTAFRTMVETESEQLRIMGESSSRIAQERFSTEQCVNKFIEEMESL